MLAHICHTPQGNKEVLGRVVKRARGNDGKVIGRTNQNPILNSRHDILEFEDGQQTELATSTIAQSMYAQCGAD